MARWVEALVLLVLAAAGVAWLSRPRPPPKQPRADFEQLGAPEVEWESRAPADPQAHHLAASTAAHGTHTRVRDDGVPSLDGQASFAELGGSTDDRVARITGSLQRRRARTLSRPKTAQAMGMMTPWLEPHFTKNQQQSWWGNDEVVA